MEIDREIFDAVYKLLEAQGLTQQWKAQIRTEVINTIENEQKIGADAEAPTPKNYQRLRKLYKSPAARLTFHLVFELLDNLSLTYTESVLKAETDLEDSPKSREDLLQAFEDLSEEDEDSPILVQLVRKYMREETSQNTQESNQYEESDTFVNSGQDLESESKESETPDKSQKEKILPNETYLVTSPTISQEESEIPEEEQFSSPSTEN